MARAALSWTLSPPRNEEDEAPGAAQILIDLRNDAGPSPAAGTKVPARGCTEKQSAVPTAARRRKTRRSEPENIVMDRTPRESSGMADASSRADELDEEELQDNGGLTCDVYASLMGERIGERRQSRRGAGFGLRRTGEQEGRGGGS